MSPLKKILLLNLPPAVSAAIMEQMPPQGFALTCQAADEVVDMVVGTAAEEGSFPGSPVLRLVLGGPLRLGTLLRQIGQILEEPVLYLDDIPLGGWIFRPQEKTLSDGADKEIALTDREVDMLAYLVKHRRRLVSREEILQKVWHYQDGVDTHTLETHIYRLRQKMGAALQGVLVTDAGGYRLCMDAASV